MSTAASDSVEAVPSLPPPERASRPLPDEPMAIRGRPGDLTPSWRLLLAMAWVLAFFAYAAIWNASVQIGIGTWWVGPRAQPPFLLVRLLPFFMCIIVLLCIVYHAPRLLQISAVATGFAAVGAIPDFSRSIGLGVAEAVVAGLLAVVTAAALTGRYRLEPAPQPVESTGEEASAPAITGPPSVPPPPAG